MHAITLLRTATVFAVMILSGGCTDGPTGPDSPDLVTTSIGTITVIPRSATIRTGEVISLKAMMTDQYGSEFEAVAVTWRSSNEGIATVSPSGEVLGTGAGDAVITAAGQAGVESSMIHVIGSAGEKELKPNIEEGRVQ